MGKRSLVWLLLEKFLRLETRFDMTAADLQTAVEALQAAVVKIQAEIADLKNQPPPLIDQAQLDATTQAVTDAATTLQGL